MTDQPDAEVPQLDPDVDLEPHSPDWRINVFQPNDNGWRWALKRKAVISQISAGVFDSGQKAETDARRRFPNVDTVTFGSWDQ